MTTQAENETMVGGLIVEYSKTEAALSMLKQQYGGIVFDVSTAAGMKSAKEARAELRGYRVSLEKTRKDIKAPALKRCKDIDDEAKRITKALTDLEEPIDSQIKAEEERKEREKAERERKEAERIAGIRQKIAAVRAIPAEFAMGGSDDELAATIEDMAAFQPTEQDFFEFVTEMQDAVTSSLGALRSMHEQRQAAAKEAAKLAEERAEIERQRVAMAAKLAEQEEAARKEREAEEARLRDEREAFERERAELARQREELQLQQAEAQRQQDEAEAQRQLEEEYAKMLADEIKVEAEAETVPDVAPDTAEVTAIQPATQIQTDTFETITREFVAIMGDEAGNLIHRLNELADRARNVIGQQYKAAA